MSSVQNVLLLNGLDCAGCAAKIEQEIEKLTGVKNVSINFTSQRLVIETDEQDKLNSIIEEAIKIIKKIEPGVDPVSEQLETIPITRENLNTKVYLPKGKTIKLVLSSVFFVLALTLKLPPAIQFAFYLISYFLVGSEIIGKAFKNLACGYFFDENFLMSLATIGAFGVKAYPEGVAVMLFYQVGELFQDLAVDRSRQSIAALMKIRPDYANLKLGAETKRLLPEDVKIGDSIIVKPGEKIPLDGRVKEGQSVVDPSALTGESLPKKVEVGSPVLAGFINKSGLLTIEVSKEFGQTTVAKILDLVQNAGSRKAPTEKFITKFAKAYTPIIVLTALLIALIPPFLIKGTIFFDWLYRALIFLVISCPCALVISIPLGFFGGIGAASKNGILIKGSSYLEALNKIDTVIFDKTGTLTKGVFKVTGIYPIAKYTQEELIEYAALAEAYSNHPLAKSILKAYNKKIDQSRIEKYLEIPGQGVKAKTNEGEILAGNALLMGKERINHPQLEVAETTVHLALDKEYLGYLIISDELKVGSKETINSLKQLGVRKIVMLTGDVKSAGEKTANQLGIDEVYTELLPDQKVEKLELLENQKSPQGKLLFVGDGINDAPVLARADIGIAMGGLGSDAAIEAADLVIMTDEPSKIISAIKIAKTTQKIVWQNIIFALGTKAAVLILGALGHATMWQAVFADVGVSVLAVFNALRILRFND